MVSFDSLVITLFLGGILKNVFLSLFNEDDFAW